MGFLDKFKNARKDRLAVVIAGVQSDPKLFKSLTSKQKSHPAIAFVAVESSADNWEFIDESLKRKQEFIDKAVVANPDVLGKIYPKGIQESFVAKHFYNIIKENKQEDKDYEKYKETVKKYFASDIKVKIENEEKDRESREKFDAAMEARMEARRKKPASVSDEAKKDEVKAEEKPEKKPETPQEKLFGLIRMYVDDNIENQIKMINADAEKEIKALDETKEADKIEKIKEQANKRIEKLRQDTEEHIKETLGKISEAIEAVGTINITDEEGKSLLKNFFEYNRSVIVWRELEKWCKKEKVDIEDELLTWLSNIEGEDSPIYKEVQKYVDEREKEKKFEKKYNSYCKKLEKGKIKINEVPPKFVDKAMCMLYIEKEGATGYWDLLGLGGDFQADEDICRLVVAKDPSAIDTINEDIAKKIMEEREADEEK